MPAIETEPARSARPSREVAPAIVVFDKPRGWTSHDLVDRVREALGTRRVGHAGTLDPAATGVVVCAVGRATRAFRFLDTGEKEYVVRVRLGIETTTGDADGAPVGPAAEVRVTAGELEGALGAFRGEILQVPPAVSAIKVGGVPLYRRVRRGEEVSPPPRRVNIRELELLEFDSPVVRLRMVTSAGTYVRSVASDLGRALGCGAHVEDLRRTRAGRYRIADALRPGADGRLDRAALEAGSIPMAVALEHLVAIRLDSRGTSATACGSLPPGLGTGGALEPGTHVRLLTEEGALVAIATAGPAGLELACVFAPAGPGGDSQ